MLDLFYQHITTNASLISDGSSQFPRKPVFHPVNRESFTIATPTKVNLLVAHLGAAILAMYDLVHRQHSLNGMESVNALNDAADAFEPRIKLLERIAERGLASVVVIGSDAAGYRLTPPDVPLNPAPPRHVDPVPIAPPADDLDEELDSTEDVE